MRRLGIKDSRGISNYVPNYTFLKPTQCPYQDVCAEKSSWHAYFCFFGGSCFHSPICLLYSCYWVQPYNFKTQNCILYTHKCFHTWYSMQRSVYTGLLSCNIYSYWNCIPLKLFFQSIPLPKISEDQVWWTGTLLSTP